MLSQSTTVRTWVFMGMAMFYVLFLLTVMKFFENSEPPVMASVPTKPVESIVATDHDALPDLTLVAERQMSSHVVRTIVKWAPSSSMASAPPASAMTTATGATLTCATVVGGSFRQTSGRACGSQCWDATASWFGASSGGYGRLSVLKIWQSTVGFPERGGDDNCWARNLSVLLSIQNWGRVK